jgi:hypothetical protein
MIQANPAIVAKIIHPRQSKQQSPGRDTWGFMLAATMRADQLAADAAVYWVDSDG